MRTWRQDCGAHAACGRLTPLFDAVDALAPLHLAPRARDLRAEAVGVAPSDCRCTFALAARRLRRDDLGLRQPLEGADKRLEAEEGKAGEGSGAAGEQWLVRRAEGVGATGREQQSGA